MPDHTMEFCCQDPKRERPSGLGVAIVGVGPCGSEAFQAEPLGHPHGYPRWGPFSAVRIHGVQILLWKGTG